MTLFCVDHLRFDFRGLGMQEQNHKNDNAFQKFKTSQKIHRVALMLQSLRQEKLNVSIIISNVWK